MVCMCWTSGPNCCIYRNMVPAAPMFTEKSTYSITVPCKFCDGTGKVENGDVAKWLGPCPGCHGAGVHLLAAGESQSGTTGDSGAVQDPGSGVSR